MRLACPLCIFLSYMAHDPFYWSKEWRAFRAAVLRERPRCEVAGCGDGSAQVDHVISRRRGGAPLDRANARALCRSHHSEKTARRDGGFGNKRGDGDVRARGCGVDGRPLDPLHPWNKGG